MNSIIWQWRWTTTIRPATRAFHNRTILNSWWPCFGSAHPERKIGRNETDNESEFHPKRKVYLPTRILGAIVCRSDNFVKLDFNFVLIHCVHIGLLLCVYVCTPYTVHVNVCARCRCTEHCLFVCFSDSEIGLSIHSKEKNNNYKSIISFWCGGASV